MLGHRWRITDPTGVTQTFLVNPNRGGSPQYRRSFTAENHLGPRGSALLLEAQRPLRTGSFSGSILTPEQYNQLLAWFEIGGALTVVDDFGRAFTIVITEFLPQREYSSARPHRHSYTVNYFVTGGLDDPRPLLYPAVDVYPAPSLYPGAA